MDAKDGVTLLVLALALLSPHASSFAQPNPGDIGVYFDGDGTQRTASVFGFTTYDVYVVTFDVPGGMNAFELGATVAPELLVTGLWVYGRSGICVDCPTLEHMTSGFECVNFTGGFTVARFSLGYFQSPVVPNDLEICVTPSTPTSFDPPAPGYRGCANEEQPFSLVHDPGLPDGCLVLNPSTVSAGETSWGHVKSRF